MIVIRVMFPHADSVVTRVIFSCAVLLLITTLMATGYYVIRKHDTVDKGVPVLPAHLDSETVAS